MVLDHIFLEQFGGVDSNSLCYLLNNNVPRNNNVDTIDVEPDINQHSSYRDDASLTNLFEARTYVFSILSLNCQSLNANIDQINIKLQQLKSNGHEFNTFSNITHVYPMYLSISKDICPFFISLVVQLEHQDWVLYHAFPNCLVLGDSFLQTGHITIGHPFDGYHSLSPSSSVSSKC